jgi:hypothetical protein
MLKKITTQILMLAMVLLLAHSDLFAQQRRTRIRFRAGSSSATVSGRIAAGASRSFVLGSSTGQRLRAVISSRNDCVVFDSGGTTNSFETHSGDNFLSIHNRCGRVNFSLTVSIE